MDEQPRSQSEEAGAELVAARRALADGGVPRAVVLVAGFGDKARWRRWLSAVVASANPGAQRPR